MKNIIVIEPKEMDDFFANFWYSDEFKELQQTHRFFQDLINKLKISPIFFFDISHENGRYHLSSHFRFIANREYENNYIRDLYYFHELLHCAEFKPSKSTDYSFWKEKLNNNELYASIVSEVLIYYMQPKLIGKTFNPLWAEKFYKQDISTGKDSGDYGFFEKNSDFNSMSFDEIDKWSDSVQNIVLKRMELRSIENEEDVIEEAEKAIVKYNKFRDKWIEKWKPHYLKIDSLLLRLKNGEISTNQYVEEILLNCDSSGRAFFPK